MRLSSGGVLLGAGLLAALVGAAPLLASAEEEHLREALGGGHVDWGQGRISAGAGAAPDHRLPSPDIARAGASKRARLHAEAALRETLGRLPVGQKLSDDAKDRAVAAADETIEYQADGGAWIKLDVPFGPWLDATHKTSAAGDKASANPWRDPLVLAVPAMRPVAGPVLEDKGKKVVLWRARYREGVAPSGQHALELEASAGGVLRAATRGQTWPEDLGQRDVLIYVKKLSR